MTHIFTLDDVDDFSDKINLDELYEKKKQADLQQLNTFNKILQRIHSRVKFISRQKKEQYCFFIVPEIIIGIPKYDHAECVAYLFTNCLVFILPPSSFFLLLFNLHYLQFPHFAIIVFALKVLLLKDC